MKEISLDGLRSLVTQLVDHKDQFPLKDTKALKTLLLKVDEAEALFEDVSHEGPIHSANHALSILLGGDFADVVSLSMIRSRLETLPYPLANERTALEVLTWIEPYGVPLDGLLRDLSYPVTGAQAIEAQIFKEGFFPRNTSVLRISGVSEAPQKAEKEGSSDLGRKLEMLQMLRERLKQMPGRGPVTFKSVLPSESNQFVRKALNEVIAERGKFNPLLIAGPHGSGKSIHLAALAGTIEASGLPKPKVHHAEGLKATFSGIDPEGTVAFLEAQGDWLVIDDLQALAGDEAAESGLVTVLEAAVSNDIQVCIACESPLTQLSTLARALLTRFSKRLITELGSPDVSLRKGVLKTRLRALGYRIDESALESLAEAASSDLHAIDAFLSPVKELPRGSPITVRELRALGILKEPAADGGAEVPRVEGWSPFAPGRSYLIEAPAKQVFSAVGAARGFRFVISRQNPRLLEGEVDLGGAGCLWLTERESDAVPTLNPDLEKVVFTIREMIEGECQMVVLDGLEYLIGNHGFDPCMRMIRQLMDDFSMTSASFLIIYDPEVYREQERTILERELTHLAEIEFRIVSGTIYFRTKGG